MKYAVTKKAVNLNKFYEVDAKEGEFKLPAFVRVVREDGGSVEKLLELEEFCSPEELGYTKTRKIPAPQKKPAKPKPKPPSE
jgi:hypothetical protein